MKKISLFFAAVAALSLIVACNKEQPGTNNNNSGKEEPKEEPKEDKTVTLTVTLPEGYTFAASDKIDVYTADKKSVTLDKEGTATGATATFKTEGLEGELICVYPSGAKSFDFTAQDGTLEGLSKLGVCYGKGTVAEKAASVTLAALKPSVLHLTNLAVFSPNDTIITEISVKGARFAASATLNVEKGVLEAGEEGDIAGCASGWLVVNKQGSGKKEVVDENAQPKDAYLAFLPLDTEEDQLKFFITTSDGSKLFAKYKAETEYQAGQTYDIDGIMVGEYVYTGEGNECSLINFDEPAGSAPSPCWFQSWASDGKTKEVEGHDGKVYSAFFTPWSWQSVAACTRRERLLDLSEWKNIEFDMYIDNANPQPWSFLPKFFNDPNAYMDGDEYARKWVDKSGFVDQGKQWIHITWPISSFDKKKGDDSYTKVRAIRIVYGGDKGEKDEILFDNFKLTRD